MAAVIRIKIQAASTRPFPAPGAVLTAFGGLSCSVPGLTPGGWCHCRPISQTRKSGLAWCMTCPVYLTADAKAGSVIPKSIPSQGTKECGLGG